MMGFWFFMLAVVSLVPLTMIGFGRLFMKKAPDDINLVFGYRTARSMKNRDTWNFAHSYIGRLWFISGAVVLPLSIVLMLFVWGKSSDTVGTVGGVIVNVQLVPLLAAIIPTESALKKTFDDAGNRR